MIIYCAVCGCPCVPMADYSQPVCPRCDASHEDAVLRMFMQPDDGCPQCGGLPCRCRAIAWRAEDAAMKQRPEKASRTT